MNPKGQHIIPRLHLKHFAGSNPTGQVWTYDKLVGKQWSAIPDETAVQTHFYSAELADGSMDTSIEVMLAKIEDRAGPIYENLLKGIFPADAAARLDFSLFLAVMVARTTTMRRMAAQTISKIYQLHSYAYAAHPQAFETLVRDIEKKRGEKMPEGVKETIRQKLLNPSGQVIVPKEHTFMALQVAEPIALSMDKMKWSLVRAMEGYYITSDNPVTRVIDPTTFHPIRGDGGWNNKTAQVSFPLSPSVLLMMSWEENAVDLGGFPLSLVEMMNNTRASFSDQYLYAHIKDEKISKLGSMFKEARPTMQTSGFGPDKFADTKIARRSKRDQGSAPA